MTDRIKNRLSRGLAALAVILFMAAILHPWWLGPLMGAYLGTKGVTVETVRVEGYTHWVLEGIDWETKGMKLEAEEARLWNPLFWIFSRGKAAESGEVMVGIRNWVLWIDSPAGGGNEAPTRASGIPPIPGVARQALEGAGFLADWLPTARLEEGRVEVGAVQFSLGQVDWKSGSLSLTGQFSPGEKDFELEVETDVEELRFQLDGGDWVRVEAGSLNLARARSLEVEAKGALLSGPLAVTGRFLKESPLPDSLEFTLGEPELPGLGGLVPGLRIGEQQMRGEWDGERWQWNWRASGELNGSAFGGLQVPEGKDLSWSLAAVAEGDLSRLWIREGVVDLGLLNLHLQTPLEIPLWDPGSGSVGELAGVLDLDHGFFEELPVDGKAEFKAQFQSVLDSGGGIRMYFDGDGRRVSRDGVAIGTFSLSGSYENQRLAFEKGGWKQGDSALRAGGEIRFKGDPALRLNFEGAFGREDFPLLFTFLPAMASVAGEGEVGGSFSHPVVNGRFSGKGLKLPGMKALDVDLSMVNAGLKGGRFTLEGRAEDRALGLGGLFSGEGGEFLEVVLSEGRLVTPGKPNLSLVDAVVLSFEPGEEGEPSRVGLKGGLALESESGDNAILVKLLAGEHRVGEYPRSLELTARGLSSGWVDPWLEADLPVLGIDDLRVRTGETFLSGMELFWEGRFETEALGGVKADLQARTADESLLLLESLSLRGEETALAVLASGRLPLRMESGSEERMLPALDPEGSVELEGSIELGGPPYAWSSGGMEFQIGQLVADYQLAGPLNELEGHFATRGNHFMVETAGWDQPLRLEGWDVEGSFREKFLVLEGRARKLMETTLDVQATLPMPELVGVMLGEEGWQALTEGSIIQVESGEVRLSDWEGFLPAGILPTGTLGLDLTYRKAHGLQGEVGFDGLSTPVGGNGVALREVEGALRFEGFEGVLEPTRLVVGGRPAELRGEWNWDFENPDAAMFRIDLTGEGLPVVRQSDLLLRSNVDLRLERVREGGPVRLSGKLGLRDGLFLQDFIGFIQPGTTTAMRRPPYFQVTAKPFADWELDVALMGERFLRVNAPVARGTLSADLELRGTLETPYLVGIVSLDEGSFKLPFGRVEAESGQAEFTLVQPYDPEIQVTGVSNTLGYRVDVRVGGRLSSPEIELESNPALTNDEIVLLLTAGILPDTNLNDSVSSASSRLALYLGRGVLGDLLGYSAAERLRVRYGESISESGLETYQVEYDLRKDLSIIGEYDKYDHYNLDLRYRLGGGKR